MKNDLKKLGFTPNEIEVYTALVKVGESQMNGIINEIKKHRQIIYNALDSLERKNMIIKTKRNNIYHYKVNNPDTIINNIQKQELIAQRLSKTVQQQLTIDERAQKINVYSGKDKIHDYLLGKCKKLPEGSTINLLTNYPYKCEDIIGCNSSLKKYNNLLTKKKINIKIIGGESKRKEFVKTIQEVKKSKKYKQIKFLDDNLIGPITLEIFHKGVSFLSFEKDCFIIEIGCKKFTKSYNKYFENLWKIAQK